VWSGVWDEVGRVSPLALWENGSSRPHSSFASGHREMKIESQLRWITKPT